MDIIKKLRAWHSPGETITGDVQLYLDAADELERMAAQKHKLYIALERLCDALWDSDLEIEPSSHPVNKAYIDARHALEEWPMRPRPNQTRSNDDLRNLLRDVYDVASSGEKISDGLLDRIRQQMARGGE